MQQLIYIGDPLCSWCWGISSALDQLLTSFKEELGLQLVMGGLRPGGGQEWTPSFQAFLGKHWRQVEERTGQPFNHDLLLEAEFDYDTEPPCRALCVARDMAAAQQFDFFKAIQKRFYVDNEDPKRAEFYKPICIILGIPFDSFQKKFNSVSYKQRTLQDFQRATELGIRSFPTILFQRDEQFWMIAQGYDTFENMQHKVSSLLEG